MNIAGTGEMQLNKRECQQEMFVPVSAAASPCIVVTGYDVSDVNPGLTALMQRATGSGTSSAPLNRENIKEIVASPAIFISSTCFFRRNETRTRSWRAESRHFESRRHQSAFYDMTDLNWRAAGS
jgi:hypothetical protein